MEKKIETHLQQLPQKKTSPSPYRLDSKVERCTQSVYI